MQQNLDAVTARGASLVAFTPQLPEHSRALAEQHRIGFDIMTDPGNQYAELLGLRFALPDDLRAVYLGFGVDLPKHNGEPSWTLPMPGRYVIAQDGVIAYAEVNPDYTRRPDPSELLPTLKQLARAVAA